MDSMNFDIAWFTEDGILDEGTGVTDDNQHKVHLRQDPSNWVVTGGLYLLKYYKHGDWQRLDGYFTPSAFVKHDVTVASVTTTQVLEFLNTIGVKLGNNIKVVTITEKTPFGFDAERKVLVKE